MGLLDLMVVHVGRGLKTTLDTARQMGWEISYVTSHREFTDVMVVHGGCTWSEDYLTSMAR